MCDHCELHGQSLFCLSDVLLMRQLVNSVRARGQCRSDTSHKLSFSYIYVMQHCGRSWICHLTSSYTPSFCFVFVPGSRWSWTCCQQTNGEGCGSDVVLCLEKQVLFFTMGIIWQTDVTESFHRESPSVHSTLEKPDQSVAAVPQITGGWACVSPSVLPAHLETTYFYAVKALIDFFPTPHWCQASCCQKAGCLYC